MEKHIQDYFRSTFGYLIWSLVTTTLLFLIYLEEKLDGEMKRRSEFVFWLLAFVVALNLFAIAWQLVNPKRRKRFLDFEYNTGYFGHLKRKYGEDHIDLQVAKEMELQERKKNKWTLGLIYSVPIIALVANIYVWTN